MDEYNSFAELKAKQIKDKDFRVQARPRVDAKIAVVAPHGGEIEPGTSELAIEIAGSDLSFAVFEGIKEGIKANSVLHITSTNFDEPHCVEVVTQTLAVLTIHGEASRGAVAYIGGRDETLRKHIGDSLAEAKFEIKEHKNPALQGKSPKNICNRGSSGCGVQLELSHGLRSTFFESLDTQGRASQTDSFHKFVKAVRRGLARANML
jgi:phage replication-related protein YjqB (UPF0714/DUF867 family)